MAKPPGRCIFCRGFGLTKEHILPNWLRAIFPRLSSDTHTFGAVDWVTLPKVGTVPLPSRRQDKGQIGSRTVKVVCGSCNNGWLSRIESGAKPILEDLIYGRPRSLSVSDQRILATWIAKTVMTAEFLKPKETAIKQAERESFRLTPEPGPHWQIWGAYYLGSMMFAGGIFHHGVGVYLPPKPVRVGVKNTQLTAIGLGRFLAFAMSSEENGLTFNLNPKLDVALKRLWPPSGNDIAWPLPAGIDDEGLQNIVAAFGRSLGLEMPRLG